MSRSPPGGGTPGWDGETTLHCYLLDYLHKRNYVKAARAFAEESGTQLEAPVPIDAPQGLLYEWWTVFWDVFLAQTGKTSNRFASVYVQHSVNQKNGVVIRGQPQQQQQSTGAPPPGTPQAYGQPVRQAAVNGHSAGTPVGHGQPQPLPPPQGGRHVAYNQQVHQNQQAAARLAIQQQQQLAASQGHPPPQAQQHGPRPAQQPAHYSAQSPARLEQQMPYPTEFSADFIHECMRMCGLAGRDINGLSDTESVTLSNCVRSNQAQHAQHVQNARMMQAQAQHQQQQQQQQAAQGQAQQAQQYGTSHPTPNGSYYYNPASPAPPGAPTPMQYQASPPPSASSSQIHFNQSGPPGTAPPQSARRNVRPGGPSQQQQISAPPTPELVPANIAPMASPRGRKRARMEGPSQSHQAPQPPQAATPNAYDQYMANGPARPSSAASGRGAASSPHMAQQYASIPPHMQGGHMLEPEQSGVNGLVAGAAPDRKRSPMAPPPLPSASLGQIDDPMAHISRPNSDEGQPSPANHASPAPNGLPGPAPGSVPRSGGPSTSSASAFYGMPSVSSAGGLEINGVNAAGDQPGAHAPSADAGLFEHGGHLDFNSVDMSNIDFDMSAYINVGADEYIGAS